jgi:hypothetical protein
MASMLGLSLLHLSLSQPYLSTSELQYKPWCYINSVGVAAPSWGEVEYITLLLFFGLKFLGCYHRVPADYCSKNAQLLCVAKICNIYNILYKSWFTTTCSLQFVAKNFYTISSSSLQIVYDELNIVMILRFGYMVGSAAGSFVYWLGITCAKGPSLSIRLFSTQYTQYVRVVIRAT